MPDPLRQTAEARLATLRHDLANGRAQLARLQEVLPKIDGAIQVLEELLAVQDPAPAPEEALCPNLNEEDPTTSA